MSGAIATAAIVGGIGAAGSIGGAAISSHAAGQAANTQAQAADQSAQLQYQASQNALDFQKQQWGTTQQNIAPWLQSGTGALSNLDYLMGISPQSPQAFAGASGAMPAYGSTYGGSPATGGGSNPYSLNPGILPGPGTSGSFNPGGPATPYAQNAYGVSNGATNLPSNSTSGATPFPGSSGGAAVPPPAYGNYNQKPGANIHATAYGSNPASLNPGGLPGSTSLNGGTLQPFPGHIRLPGSNGGAAVPQGGANPGGGFGSLMQPWSQQFQAPTNLTEQNDPGYQARLQLGTDAIQRSAAAAGGVVTGGTARALDQYGQDYASNEYNNVYNRALTGYDTNYNTFEQNQANQFNRLAALSGVGQTAAGQLSSAGQAASNNVSSNLIGTAQGMGQAYQNAAAANASGYVGAANAWSGALGNAGNNISQLALLQQLYGGGGGGSSDALSGLGGIDWTGGF